MGVSPMHFSGGNGMAGDGHATNEVTRPLSKLASHALLVAVAFVMMTPFVWMVLASFKTLADIESPGFWPTEWHPENYKHVFDDPQISTRINFAWYYFNSLFVALWVTFLTCL